MVERKNDCFRGNSMAIDPVTTTLLVINGGLLLGNGLLYLTSPTRNQLIASDIKSREKLPDAVIAAARKTRAARKGSPLKT